MNLRSTKPRSRRLRKKLHVGEFHEIYIQITFEIRKDHAAMKDIDAWCDFHDDLFDIIIECGADPGTTSSSGHEIELSFTQNANKANLSKVIANKIAEKIDVRWKAFSISLPVDAWNWDGWDALEDPFDYLGDMSYHYEATTA